MRRDFWRLATVFATSGAAILLFSDMPVLGLVGFIGGAVSLSMGFLAGYRPAAILGLLIMCVVAATAVSVDTLTTVGQLLTATLGLMLPMSGLTWFALSVEPHDESPGAQSRRPAVLSTAYMLACVLLVPAAAFVMGLLVPNISELFTRLMEISIISVVAIVGSVLADPKDGSDDALAGRSQ